MVGEGEEKLLLQPLRDDDVDVDICLAAGNVCILICQARAATTEDTQHIHEIGPLVPLFCALTSSNRRLEQ